jgi:phosphorylcholine metabolism protein LicD
MRKYFKDTLNIIQKINIKYFIGAESLVALNEDNLFKYSENLKIYIYNFNFLKIMALFIILLKNKIILKPKIEHKKLLFKLRHKPNLFSKDKTFIKIFLMKENTKNYSVEIGNKKTLFKKEDIEITNKKIDDINVSVPIKIDQFVLKYKDELLSDFYKNYNTNFDSKGEKAAVKLMIDVKNIIENLSIDYWIEGGTLLGAAREQKLIPWDHDIDMGMINHSNDTIKKMIHSLKKKFYVSVKTFNNMEGVWDLGEYRVIKVYPKKYFFLKDELCLDIFIYYKGNVPNMKNEVYKYVVWGKNAFHKKEFFDNLEKIEFYGESISVPSNYREFLKVKYGDDWETPKKKWNVAIDDGSILQS